MKIVRQGSIPIVTNSNTLFKHSKASGFIFEAGLCGAWETKY
jgi:hypothetical protein